MSSFLCNMTSCESLFCHNLHDYSSHVFIIADDWPSALLSSHFNNLNFFCCDLPIAGFCLLYKFQHFLIGCQGYCHGLKMSNCLTIGLWLHEESHGFKYFLNWTIRYLVIFIISKPRDANSERQAPHICPVIEGNTSDLQ